MLPQRQGIVQLHMYVLHMRMYVLSFTSNVKGYEALDVDTNAYGYLD